MFFCLVFRVSRRCLLPSCKMYFHVSTHWTLIRHHTTTPRRCTEELPEKCLGVIRLINLDLDGAEPLDHVNPASPPTISPPEGSPYSEGEAAPAGSRRAGRRERSVAVGIEGPRSIAVSGAEPVAPSPSGRAIATNA